MKKATIKSKTLTYLLRVTPQCHGTPSLRESRSALAVTLKSSALAGGPSVFNVGFFYWGGLAPPSRKFWGGELEPKNFALAPSALAGGSWGVFLRFLCRLMHF